MKREPAIAKCTICAGAINRRVNVALRHGQVSARSPWLHLNPVDWVNKPHNAEPETVHGVILAFGHATRLVEVVDEDDQLSAETVTLECDGGWSCCDHNVTMIGSKGYIYCTPCGVLRRGDRERVRKLKPAELRKLQRGEPLATY